MPAMPLLPPSTPARPHRGRITPTHACLAALALVACSTADTSAVDGGQGVGDDGSEAVVARMASGTVPGTDLFVATVYDESTDQAIAYFCGGDATFQTHTRWFSGGEPMDDTFEYSQDGWAVTVEGDASGAAGTLTEPDGTSHAFTTTAPGPDSVAGLYSAEMGDCTAGVVVVDVAGEPQAQGTYFCTEPALFVQVIILSPVALTPDGGLQVEVPLPDGTTSILVNPI